MSHKIYSMKDCEVNFEVIPINLVCDAFLLNLYHSPIQYCIELLLYQKPKYCVFVITSMATSKLISIQIFCLLIFVAFKIAYLILNKFNEIVQFLLNSVSQKRNITYSFLIQMSQYWNVMKNFDATHNDNSSFYLFFLYNDIFNHYLFV